MYPNLKKKCVAFWLSNSIHGNSVQGSNWTRIFTAALYIAVNLTAQKGEVKLISICSSHENDGVGQSSRVQSMASRARLSKFKMELCHSLAVWHEASYLISLCLSFLVYKMGALILPNTQHVVKTGWIVWHAGNSIFAVIIIFP